MSETGVPAKLYNPSMVLSEGAYVLVDKEHGKSIKGRVSSVVWNAGESKLVVTISQDEEDQ